MVKLSSNLKNSFIILLIIIAMCVLTAIITTRINNISESRHDLLISFEKVNFINKEIINVDSINSGDVRIKLNLTEFIDTSENKRIYRTGKVNTYYRTYHTFEKMSDGELVEYYYSIQFNLEILECKGWWGDSD